MRRPLFLVPWLLVVVVAGSACSLAVQSELDSKSTATGGEGGTGGTSPGDGGVEADAQDGAGGGDTDAPTDQATDPISDSIEEPISDGADDVTDATEEDSGGCATCVTQCCHGVCVDTATDAEHCGACDHPCFAGRLCSAGQCSGGWVDMADDPQQAERAGACAVWAGDRMFVWGGVDRSSGTLRDDGLTYDPLTDVWDPVAMEASTPSARTEPVCVWTGSRVFVWGGVDPVGKVAYSDGALWDPLFDTWEPLGSGGPVGRARPVAVWTGKAVILWGGANPTNNAGVKSGGIWDEATAQWTAVSVTSAPTRNKELTGVWSGTDMLLFGGRDDGGGNVYNTLFGFTPPPSNLWGAVVPSGTAPAIRSSAFAAYMAGHMLIWGGMDKDRVPIGIGGRAKISAPTAWLGMSAVDAPTPRASVPFESGWTVALGGEMHVLGGMTSNGTAATDGGTYRMGADAWSAIDSWGPDEHLYGVGVWTGSEFIVWGGYDGATPLPGGHRWMP